ncbi:MAG: hypothetical protein IJB70_07465 [Clostridia bacterium]|nr:hypothetical protein [Clostridia bacterium]
MSDNKQSNEYRDDLFEKYDNLEELFGDEQNDDNNAQKETDSLKTGDDGQNCENKHSFGKFARVVLKIFKFVYVFITLCGLLVSVNTTIDYISLSSKGNKIEATVLKEVSKEENGDYIYSVSYVYNGETVTAECKTDIEYDIGETFRAFTVPEQGSKNPICCDNADMNAFLASLLCVIAVFMFFETWIVRCVGTVIFGMYGFLMSVFVNQNSIVGLNIITLVVFAAVLIKKLKSRKN